MNIIISLLHMDDINIQPLNSKDSSVPVEPSVTEPAEMSSTGSKKKEMMSPVAFVQTILTILQQCMPPPGLELEPRSSSSKGGLARKGSTRSASFPGKAAKKAWLKQLESLHNFVDDWNWRLAVLQRLSPSTQRPWQWREALAVLRAAPSTILNMWVL